MFHRVAEAPIVFGKTDNIRITERPPRIYKDAALFQRGTNMSRVTAIVCESRFGLFMAAPATVQCGANICASNARVQLPATTEELMNKIASITG